MQKSYFDNENFEKSKIVYERDVYRLALLQNRAEQAMWKLEKFITRKRWFRSDYEYWEVIQWALLKSDDTLEKTISWIDQHYEPIWHKEFDNEY